MKFFAFPAAIGLIISLATVTPALNNDNDGRSSEPLEKSTPVDPSATITVCVLSGTIDIRGWDKNEVRVRSADAAVLDFRRIDKVKEKPDHQLPPPTRVDVMVMDRSDKRGAKGDCQAIADVELEVPHGSTVQVQTRDGDITINGIAAAYAGSQNGDITISRVTKIVEAGSVGGSITLRDSAGRVNLSSAGGPVEAHNVKYTSSEDSFEVGTVSGDIRLYNVSNSQLVAKTVNGTVTMTGALAKSGQYAFTTLSGDIILAMPSNSSFQLVAKVSEKHDLVSEFPLKFSHTPTAPAPTPSPRTPGKVTPKAPAKSQPPVVKNGPATTAIVRPTIVTIPYSLRRIIAICGSGDATISINSFSGIVQLKKM